MRGRSLARALTAGALAAGLLALPVLATSAQAGETTRARASTPALKVMTKNLYLGTDINRPIAAVVGKTDPAEMLTALANATDEARDIVDRTDFGTRSRLLAKEIAARKPDLVGLQEVALWRSGPIEVFKATELNAETVDLDYLKMLLAALRAEGVRYKAVSVNWLADVEAPAFEGTLQDPKNPRDVRMTMRDVILKRIGSGIKILKHRERQYTHNLEVSIAGKTLNFGRGYQWVDAQRGDQRFRFINTHLEAFSSDIAYKQAQQLLAGPGDANKTTIIVCDCNSDPLNGSVKTAIGDTQPHWAPYWLITSKGGFHDTWLQWKQPQLGWTSGLSELVDDGTAAGFDHRIDMVFARTADGNRLRVVRGAVTGNTVAAKDPKTGLWPSDHAGVVMRLRGL